MFGLFKDVDAFALELAATIAKKYPPSVANNPARKVSPARVAVVLEGVFKEAVQWKDEHRLGLVRKAKLGNEFRWRLKELGYGATFIDLATEGLMVYITRRTPAAPAGDADAAEETGSKSKKKARAKAQA